VIFLSTRPPGTTAGHRAVRARVESGVAESDFYPISTDNSCFQPGIQVHNPSSDGRWDPEVTR